MKTGHTNPADANVIIGPLWQLEPGYVIIGRLNGSGAVVS